MMTPAPRPLERGCKASMGGHPHPTGGLLVYICTVTGGKKKWFLVRLLAAKQPCPLAGDGLPPATPANGWASKTKEAGQGSFPLSHHASWL